MSAASGGAGVGAGRMRRGSARRRGGGVHRRDAPRGRIRVSFARERRRRGEEKKNTHSWRVGDDDGREWPDRGKENQPSGGGARAAGDAGAIEARDAFVGSTIARARAIRARVYEGEGFGGGARTWMATKKRPPW